MMGKFCDNDRPMHNFRLNTLCFLNISITCICWFVADLGLQSSSPETVVRLLLVLVTAYEPEVR